MVILLFSASFLLALAVPMSSQSCSESPPRGFSSRFFAKHLSAAAAKYFEFVIVFVEVTSGTRIRLLEDYIDAPAWNRPELAAQLTGGGLGGFDLPHPCRSL
jgi:hypothetical protein